MDLSEEVMLLERTTLEGYRAWTISLHGGIDNIPQRIREQIPPPAVELAELIEGMLPTDELWLCRSRVFDPMALIGDRGVALVRDGRPIKYRVVIHH